jgi:hypothetical protein
MSENEFLTKLHAIQRESLRGLLTQDEYEERVNLLVWEYLARRMP